MLDHIPYRTHKNLTGTGWYMSINSHLGIEHMRRDDLESLAYVLIYFLHGSLPWQHLEGGSKKQRYHRIMHQKLGTPTIELCSGLPDEFQIFLDYTRGLPFDTEPDYEYMHSLFQNLFVARGYHNDSSFNWRWMDLSLWVSHISGSGSGSDTESK
jgi:casein kinase I family protein HRR25